MKQQVTLNDTQAPLNATQVPVTVPAPAPEVCVRTEVEATTHCLFLPHTIAAGSNPPPKRI
jgi:hypothetical protein